MTPNIRGIEIANRGYGFINVFAGNKASGESLKELERVAKFFSRSWRER